MVSEHARCGASPETALFTDQYQVYPKFGNDLIPQIRSRRLVYREAVRKPCHVASSQIPRRDYCCPRELSLNNRVLTVIRVKVAVEWGTQRIPARLESLLSSKVPG